MSFDMIELCTETKINMRQTSIEFKNRQTLMEDIEVLILKTKNKFNHFKKLIY